MSPSKTEIFKMTHPSGMLKPAINCATMTFSIARLTGGLYFGVRELTLALRREAVDGAVITLEGGWGERLSEAELEDWRVLNPQIFPCSWPRKLGYSPKILPALKQMAPNLMHCHGLWNYHVQATCEYGRQSGIPWMLSVHGMLDGWAMRNKGWKKRVASWLYHDAAMKNATCIRALCRAEVEAIRRAGFKNPICIIPNGVELPDEQPDVKHQSAVVKQAAGKKILLFLGRIAPKKGLENLIRAWKKICVDQSRPARDWFLIIAGMDEGGHELELKRLVEELALGSSVLFPGSQYGPDKASLLHTSSAFILPSYSEGLPMSILDAWACRLPVLMTPQCNFPEGVKAGAALKILPSAEGVERGLLQLFEMNASQLATMGNNGRSLVGKHFAWPQIAGQMREVYDWMLGGGAPPACFQSDRTFSLV